MMMKFKNIICVIYWGVYPWSVDQCNRITTRSKCVLHLVEFLPGNNRVVRGNNKLHLRHSARLWESGSINKCVMKVIAVNPMLLLLLFVAFNGRTSACVHSRKIYYVIIKLTCINIFHKSFKMKTCCLMKYFRSSSWLVNVIVDDVK